MAKATDNGGSNGILLGILFVVILLLDWLSRVFILTSFPRDDQELRGHGLLLILKLLLECVCVTLITAVSIMVIEGKTSGDSFYLVLSFMFAVFALWNFFIVGILKHVDVKDIPKVVLYGYDGASGKIGKYLKYLDTLFQEDSNQATGPHDNLWRQFYSLLRAIWTWLKKFAAIISVIFICVHILLIPGVFALFSVAKFLGWELRELLSGFLVEWIFWLMMGCVILISLSAIFALKVTEGLSHDQSGPPRHNGGSIICALSISVLVFLISLYVGFPSLLWIWFCQVSAVSLMVFFMSQEREPSAR